MNITISMRLSILLILSATTINPGDNWDVVYFFFPAWRQSVSDQRNNFWGHFPQSCDGSIFKCYVNVITSTEKVLSRSPRAVVPSLSWVMKPFASEAHKLWHEHLISFPSCQKQFSDGWSVRLIPTSLSLHRSVYFMMFSGCLWVAVKLSCESNFAAFTSFSVFFSVFLPACHHRLFCIFYSFTFILRNGL